MKTITVTREVDLGEYRVSFTIKHGNPLMTAEWEPHTPPGMKVNHEQLLKYREARNAAYAEWSALTGITVGVIDLG